VHYDAQFDTVEDALASEEERIDILAAVGVFFQVKKNVRAKGII